MGVAVNEVRRDFEIRNAEAATSSGPREVARIVTSFNSKAHHLLRRLWKSLRRLSHLPSALEASSPRATFIEVPWVAQNYSRAARLIWHPERQAWTLLDVWILARAYVPDVRVEVFEQQLDPELQNLRCGQVRISRRRPWEVAEDLQFQDLSHSIEEVHLRDLQAGDVRVDRKPEIQGRQTQLWSTEPSASAVLAMRDETCVWLIFDSRNEPFRRDHAERVARGLIRRLPPPQGEVGEPIQVDSPSPLGL